MKLIIKEKFYRDKEIDITFPRYSKHDLDGDGYSSVIYRVVVPIGELKDMQYAYFRVISIKESKSYYSGSHEMSLEIEKKSFVRIAKEADYFFGLSPDYESSVEEWDEAVETFKQFTKPVIHEDTIPEESDCTHDFYEVFKGDYPTGKRCKNCGKQVWY